MAFAVVFAPLLVLVMAMGLAALWIAADGDDRDACPVALSTLSVVDLCCAWFLLGILRFLKKSASHRDMANVFGPVNSVIFLIVGLILMTANLAWLADEGWSAAADECGSALAGVVLGSVIAWLAHAAGGVALGIFTCIKKSKTAV